MKSEHTTLPLSFKSNFWTAGKSTGQLQKSLLMRSSLGRGFDLLEQQKKEDGPLFRSPVGLQANICMFSFHLTIQKLACWGWSETKSPFSVSVRKNACPGCFSGCFFCTGDPLPPLYEASKIIDRWSTELSDKSAGDPASTVSSKTITLTYQKSYNSCKTKSNNGWRRPF